MNSVTNQNTNFVQTYSWVDHLLEYRALQEQRDYETRYVEDYDTVEGFQWSSTEVQYRHEQGTWDYRAIHREDEAYEAIEAGDIYAWVDAELERRAEQEHRDYEAMNVEDFEDGEEYEDEDEDEGEMQHYCRNCNSVFGISCLEVHQSVCQTLLTELAQELSRTRPVMERSRNIDEAIPVFEDLEEAQDDALLQRKRQKCFHEYEAIPMDISDDDDVSYQSDQDEDVEDVEEEADYELAPRRLFDDEVDDVDQCVLPIGDDCVIIFDVPPAEEIPLQNEQIIADINENELIERERYEYNLYALEVIWEHGQLVATEQDVAEVARLRREIAEYEARVIV